MIGFYNYTVVLTYLGLSSGIIGICSATAGHTITALVFLMIAGLFDMFDGTVAKTRKRTEEEKKFGIQIDSLSDMVCFGVLPAVIGYTSGVGGFWGMAALILYVLAALIRLAYFNVVEEELQFKAKRQRKEYEGLPVTTVALLFPLLYILHDFIGFSFVSGYGIALVVIACAFVLKFRVRKFGFQGMLVLAILGIMELILLLAGV